MTNAYRRCPKVASAAVAAVIGLAGCGGSGTPHVASLNRSSSDSTGSTTTLPRGNPTQLLDEWAICMRSHGDPEQADPTIDANKIIHIDIPSSASGPTGLDLRNGVCGSYLTAASTALRGGKPLPRPDPAKLEKYSQCMRANGVPDFPDPTGGGLAIHVGPGSDLNPRSPTFQNASKLCAKKTGVAAFGTGTPPPGSIEATSQGGPGGGPGGNGGSGAGSQNAAAQAG